MNGTTPQELAEWLERSLPGSSVAIIEDLQHSQYIFRIRDERPGNVELAVSEEALEDWPLDAIASGLAGQNVVPWLHKTRSFRIFFDNDLRVRWQEELTVRCKGREYRVVREPAQNVRIFDPDEREIGHLGAHILPISIHRRPISQWRGEILELLGA